MFSSLRKLARSEHEEAWDVLYRLTRHVLREIQAGAVQGDDVDRVHLEMQINTLQTRLEEDSTPGQIREIGEAALRELTNYNAETTRYYRRHRAELRRMRTLVGKTLEKLTEGGAVVAARFRSLERAVEHAGAAFSLEVLKVRLNECISAIRQEAARQKELSDAITGELRSELKRIGEEGGLCPGKEPPLPDQLTEPGSTAAQAVPAGMVTLTEPKAAATETVDSVTGLPGRAEAIAAAARLFEEKKPFFAATIVIDQISVIEQRYGSQLRDEVLPFFGQQLAQSLDAHDQIFNWTPLAFLVLVERSGSKEWVRMELDRKFNVRWKKNLTTKNRSALLNIGAVWTMWPSREIRSSEELVRKVESFLRVHS